MADNSHAFAQLDAMADRLRRVAGLGVVAAPDVKDALQKQVEANVVANVDPYGHAWFPSKLGAVLRNAADSVYFFVKGGAIKMLVVWPESMHHVGSARGYHGGSAKLGGFRRPIIPFKSIPGPMKAVIRGVLTKHFKAITGGA